MDELDTAQLRDFLAGDDSLLATPKAGWGWSIADVTPFRWLNRHSEITDGKLVVRSRGRGRVVAEFVLARVSCVAHVTFAARTSEYGNSGRTWVIGEGGNPVAEVPWDRSVEKQAEAFGLSVRTPRAYVERDAFRTLRPDRRLG